MNLDWRTLEANSEDRCRFEQINEEAFPVWERMSFDEIFGFVSDTNTDVLGLYDGKTPIGFTALLKNEECGYLYYLAIDHSMRSKGYGSAALRRIREVYPNLQLTLDFEVIDENAENYAQRVRRKSFYLRNGFHETGSYTMLRGRRFELVCSGGELRREALKDLLGTIHAHYPEFSDALFESADA